ncbi:hypothetical protein GCM10010271_73260 [Streptomyces kurssanovii]|nr:hypothetical protein GCM10010271_73260 [Streptomyces kurssanovii]
MPKIAINGLGRIGRAAFKILHDLDGVEVAAVNDLVTAENLAYLLTHDTVYGRYGKSVTAAGDALVVDGRTIPLCSRRDPAELPWRELGIDLVLECTGAFRREEELARHLSAGARFVILSAPARTDTIGTVVHGVNTSPAGQQIVSCASCTTNCITPVMEVMDRRIGVERAVMITIHAYTSTQQLTDGPSKDFRRGRAGAANMLPASTGRRPRDHQGAPGAGRPLRRRRRPHPDPRRIDRRHRARHRPPDVHRGSERPLPCGGHHRPVPRRPRRVGRADRLQRHHR